MSRKNLAALGRKAAIRKKHPSVTVTVPKQVDAAFLWTPASIHPMQALQNIHQRTVREALRPVVGDDARRDEASAQLGAFCYFGSVPPRLLPPLESMAGDAHFLEERLADAIKAITKLTRVLRGLDELEDDADIDEPADTAGNRLVAQLAELRRIVAAVPNRPGSVTAIRVELDDVGDTLDEAAADDVAAFIEAAEYLEDIATRLLRILQSLCCIANFHVIDTFYLWRLLVKYRFQSNDEIDSTVKSDISGEVTSLLHNGANGATAWITAWLTAKLVDLNRQLMALDAANLFFYLKGGRALQYIMGTPQNGENDFDTGIILNPNLPPGEWYELFRNVHNICLRFLRQCKYEFIALVEANNAGFTQYVDGVDLAGQNEPDLPEDLEGLPEDVAKRFADVLMQLAPPAERASGKAELIDIGMPRRDTPEVWETWHLKPHAVTAPDGMVVPGPLYYIGEYVMMIRDAFQPGSRAAKKSPKRLKRLSDLLQTNIPDPAVDAELDHMPRRLLPQSIPATATFNNAAKAVKVVLKQMSDAYLLREDAGLTAAFDPWFAAKCGQKATVIQYSDEFLQVLAPLPQAQKDTADACGFVHAIATEMEQHILDRGEFFRRNRKEFSRFVKAIYTASIFQNQAEDLEIMFAIAGSFAARLHAEYADFEHMEDIEPLHRIDLKIFCKADADPEIILDIVAPGIIEAYKKHPETPEYIVVESHSGSVNMYWPAEETMGQFTYRPLVIRLTVEKRPGDWPQLAFVWGYPVLSLRDLVWDYIKECGHIEEFSARQRLRKTAEALTDILTRLENPGAQAVPVTPPVVVAGPIAPQGPLPPAPPPVLVPNFQTIAQQNPNWCWAAVSAMIRRFFAAENITQQQIVQGLYNNTNDQQGPLMLPGLRYHNAGQGVVLSWAALKAEIDNNRPFIFATGQHYMVAIGYEENGALRKVHYWNPLPVNAGRQASMTYQSYCNTVRAGGATYYGFQHP
jgi:hypothetical protein